MQPGLPRPPPPPGQPPQRPPGDNSQAAYFCNCRKYCKGRPTRLDLRTYTRHEPFRTTPQEVLGARLTDQPRAAGLAPIGARLSNNAGQIPRANPLLQQGPLSTASLSMSRAPSQLPVLSVRAPSVGPSRSSGALLQPPRTPTRPSPASSHASSPSALPRAVSRAPSQPPQVPHVMSRGPSAPPSPYRGVSRAPSQPPPEPRPDVPPTFRGTSRAPSQPPPEPRLDGALRPLDAAAEEDNGDADPEEGYTEDLGVPAVARRGEVRIAQQFVALLKGVTLDATPLSSATIERLLSRPRTALPQITPSSVKGSTACSN